MRVITLDRIHSYTKYSKSGESRYSTSSAIILSSSCLLFDSPMAFTRSKKSRPVTAAISLNALLFFNDDECI